MDSPNTPSKSARQHINRERIKLVSQISLLNTTIDGKICCALKIDNCPLVDDSSLTLLSLPDGPIVCSQPIQHSFHSFVITCQTGQRIYGGSYLFGDRFVVESNKCDDNCDDNQFAAKDSHSDSERSVVYVSRVLVALTVRPLVDQLRKLLEWCVVYGDCNPRWLRCVSHIRLPAKGKCLVIRLPQFSKSVVNQTVANYDTYDTVNIECDTDFMSPQNADRNQITIFRPLSALPLFDYPLRQLFTQILSPEQFLLAYYCALQETQILINSKCYYNLMLVAESLNALLNPFKWHHVYVPILPTKLGLYYLDAPTPYIMGINTNSNLTTKNLMVACRIDCDANHVELSNESLRANMPPFLDELRQELEAILTSDLRLSSSTVLQKSAALRRVTEIARKHKVIDDSFTYLDDLKLNQSIRVLFLRTIKKNILNKYQQFIISSQNRKESIKFDAVAYLSDQPQSLQPFLSQFIETQMFVSYIDETAKQLNKKHKTFSNVANEPPAMCESLYDDDYDELDLSLFTDIILESRIKSAQKVKLTDYEEIPANTTSGNNSCSPLHQQSDVLSSPRTKRRNQHLLANSQKNLYKESTVMSSPSKSVPAALTAQTNWKVVETLMREVKLKTKRILLEKMGREEVGPLGCGSVGGVEENTLIASLCDLIERIWSHARANPTNDLNRWQTGKCAFWSHLMSYYQLVCNDVVNSTNEKTYDSNTLSSALAWVLLKKRIDSVTNISVDSSSSAQSMPSSPSKQLNNNSMRQLPTTLTQDIRSICSMADIKTDVGKSRAFIRLALERKLLDKHLRTLLINQELLLTLYKRYAFLRCEEEREQFLTHLLTLNAVDLMCFTNTFTTSLLPYTLIIHGSNQFCGWFSISGTISSTSENHITNATNIYSFKHRNLGSLNTLTVCVNHSTKIFIEYCFVKNEVTGHIFKFACSRWFGRNIDDGSSERVLIGELISCSINDVLKVNQSQTRSSSIGRNWTRNSEQHNNKDEPLTVEELQTLLGENVNQIMKHYFNFYLSVYNSKLDKHDDSSISQHRALPKSFLKNSNTKSLMSSSTMSRIGPQAAKTNHNHLNSHKKLINLIFADRKLLWILTQIFYYGFKNRGRSSFRKQSYLWDYLLRLQCELKITRQTRRVQLINAEEEGNDMAFIDIIDKITNKACNYGKDSKFQLFLLISLRDHHLSPNFMKLLTRPSIALLFYENNSFVRDINLVTFLVQILNTFNEIELTFESSLTKDL